jgi:hypothetical protein
MKVKMVRMTWREEQGTETLRFGSRGNLSRIGTYIRYKLWHAVSHVYIPLSHYHYHYVVGRLTSM